ncbi:MAG: hypothetical protein U1C46_01160 [Bacteroidales bacterium]|nr:hypothetical protein [Bacteroidales bacterium]
MKTLKISLIILLSTLVFTGLYSCKKCKNEDPSARIINNGTENASVQIKTSGGNTVNINNVAPGTSSPYASYASGIVTFTITVANNNYVETVQMVECFNYDISIDSKNNITTTAIDRNN